MGNYQCTPAKRDNKYVVIYGESNSGKTSLANKFDDAFILDELMTRDRNCRDKEARLRTFISKIHNQNIVLIEQRLEDIPESVLKNAHLVIECRNPGDFTIKF